MNKKLTTQKRKLRISSKVRGNAEKLRLSVFRSNNNIYAQLIDDKARKTVVGVSQKRLEKTKETKTEKAKKLGLLLAQEAKKKNISKVVFDKGLYKYHGRVKALAEGAREGGMQF